MTKFYVMEISSTGFSNQCTFVYGDAITIDKMIEELDARQIREAVTINGVESLARAKKIAVAKAKKRQEKLRRWGELGEGAFADVANAQSVLDSIFIVDSIFSEDLVTL